MSGEDFEAYLDLVEQIAERLYREGIWPFDSEARAELERLGPMHFELMEHGKSFYFSKVRSIG